MSYFIYNTASYKIVRVLATQAEANSLASTDNSITAFSGKADDISVEDASGLWFYHTGTPNVRPYPRETDTIRLRRAAQEAYDWLIGQSLELDALSSFYPQEDIRDAKNVEFRAHQGIRAVLEGDMLSSITLTNAQKITFLENMQLGSSDAADIQELLPLIPALRTAAMGAGRTIASAPLVWVDPRDGTRVTAGQAALLSSSSATLARAGMANLALTVSSRPADLVYGAWIDDLT